MAPGAHTKGDGYLYQNSLRIENARLKKENELLKMELYLRKKVQELERGDR